jgi:hypothetical protein
MKGEKKKTGKCTLIHVFKLSDENTRFKNKIVSQVIAFAVEWWILSYPSFKIGVLSLKQIGSALSRISNEKTTKQQALTWKDRI